MKRKGKREEKRELSMFEELSFVAPGYVVSMSFAVTTLRPPLHDVSIVWQP